MRRLELLLLLVATLMLTTHWQSTYAQGSAEGCWKDDCNVSLGEGTIKVGSLETVPGGRVAHVAPDPVLQYRLVNTCLPEDPVLGGCTAQRACPAALDRVVSRFQVQSRLISAGPGAVWVNEGVSCVDITEVRPQVTPAMVLAAFRELPLPVGVVSVQPPGGQVLVNLGAIFFTTQPVEASYDVTLLGQVVHIDAAISGYDWDPGDGSAHLAGRGGLYPDESTLHVYTGVGSVEVGLTLTWSATYSVAGAPVADVPGTTTTQSPPTALTVVAAHSELVDSFD